MLDSIRWSDQKGHQEDLFERKSNDFWVGGGGGGGGGGGCTWWSGCSGMRRNRMLPLPSREKPGDDEWVRLDAQKVPFLLNYAQCQLVLGNFYDVIEQCSQVGAASIAPFCFHHSDSVSHGRLDSPSNPFVVEISSIEKQKILRGRGDMFDGPLIVLNWNSGSLIVFGSLPMVLLWSEPITSIFHCFSFLMSMSFQSVWWRVHQFVSLPFSFEHGERSRNSFFL